MISRIIYLKTSLLLALLALSLLAFAQTPSVDRRELHGKWVLENITVRDGDNIVDISQDSIGIKPCSQIEFTKEEITVIHTKNTEKGKYALEGNFLIANVPSFPVIIGFKISQKKLYLEYSQDVTDSQGNLKVLTIIFSYKQK